MNTPTFAATPLVRRKLRQEDKGGGLMHAGTLIDTGSLLRSSRLATSSKVGWVVARTVMGETPCCYA